MAEITDPDIIKQFGAAKGSEVTDPEVLKQFAEPSASFKDRFAGEPAPLSDNAKIAAGMNDPSSGLPAMDVEQIAKDPDAAKRVMAISAAGLMGPLAVAPMLGGGGAAAGGTAALLARQGIAPDIIELLAGTEPKAAGKIPGIVKSALGVGGVVAAEKAGEALGMSKETVHDIGLPMLFKLFGGH
jgi:hypothetical protein